MFTVFAQRKQAYAPIVDPKTAEVLDDGQPKPVKLGQWADKNIAAHFAGHITASVSPKNWKVWVK